MTTVMIVDDDLSMRGLLQTLLELSGFRVIAHNPPIAEELRTWLTSEKPDYLIMDIHLRGINGIELLSKVRHEYNFQDLKIIMTSGENLGDICLASGASYFLLKPYMPDDLLSLIQM